LSGEAIQSVGSIDGELALDKTTFSTAKYAKGKKYTSKKAAFYLYNGYGYVTVLKRLEIISITMLANDPEEIWNFKSACGECEDCCESILDRTFPLDNDSIRTAQGMAANTLINVFVQMREDRNNDATDNTGTQSMVHQPDEK
jgi:hypothetical protein